MNMQPDMNARAARLQALRASGALIATPPAPASPPPAPPKPKAQRTYPVEVIFGDGSKATIKASTAAEADSLADILRRVAIDAKAAGAAEARAAMQAEAPNEPRTITIPVTLNVTNEIPAATVSVALPPRKTLSTVERDGDGNIKKVTQIERDHDD